MKQLDDEDEKAEPRRVGAVDLEAARQQQQPQGEGLWPVGGRRRTLEWHVKDLSIKGRRLLGDIAGRATSGELVVIVGPSGAGKTSLLECLSLRNRGFTGALHFNGRPAGADYFSKTAVVYQTEMAHGFLTAREHLSFHAVARMGGSPRSVAGRVEEVMAELNLGKCADTLIGGPDPFFFRKGISGGERKRLMIATELLFCPEVLFLDEPTSGLDSYMAQSVLESLHHVTRRGTLVLTSLHSPSAAWAALITHVMVLTADGRLAYHGPYDKVLGYFEARVGRELAKGLSAFDFVLDSVSFKPTEPPAQTRQHLDRLVAAFEEEQSGYCVKQKLAPEASSRALLHGVGGTHANTATLVLLNGARGLAEVTRNRLELLVWALTHLVVGVALGLLILRSATSNWRKMVGQCLVVAVAQGLTASTARCLLTPPKCSKFMREYLVGRNAVGPFIFGVHVELTVQAVASLALPVTAYWMSGMVPELEKFVLFTVATMLITFATASCGFFCGCLSTNILISLATLVSLLLPMFAFSGLVYQKSAVAPYLQWLVTASVYNYGISAMLGPQLSGLSHMDRYAAVLFTEVEASHWPQDLLALAGMTLAFYCLSYLALRLRLAGLTKHTM